MYLLVSDLAHMASLCEWNGNVGRTVAGEEQIAETVSTKISDADVFLSYHTS